MGIMQNGQNLDFFTCISAQVEEELHSPRSSYSAAHISNEVQFLNAEN